MMHNAAGKVYIGIDAGATKTAVLFSGHNKTMDFVYPHGINYQRVGSDEAVSRLTTAVIECVVQNDCAPGTDSEVFLCIGIAGADTEADRAKLADQVRVALSAKPAMAASAVQVEVVPDSVVALQAAFGDGSGVVVVVGTGSIVIGRDASGQCHRTGGWGYLLGDEGSACEIGIRTLRVAAQQIDSETPSGLTQAVMKRFGLKQRADIIHRVYGEPEFVQSIAPFVLEEYSKGDEHAEAILTRAAVGIATCFGRLLDKFPGETRRQYVLSGGLSHSSAYRSLVQAAIDDVAEGWVLTQPQSERPVFGALALAKNSGK